MDAGVHCVGLVMYTLASLLCALAPSIPALIALRFVQGIAGSAGIVIARAVVRDLYIAWLDRLAIP